MPHSTWGWKTSIVFLVGFAEGWVGKCWGEVGEKIGCEGRSFIVAEDVDNVSCCSGHRIAGEASGPCLPFKSR
jgi:hypothetical protein